MKRLFPFLLLFTGCFLFEDEDENQNTNLNMSIHSVGVTSVNLNITPDDTTATYSFEIDRNDTTVLSLYQISNDTLVNVGGLEPNTLNTLTLNRVLANTRTPLDTVSFTTMDTTSHNFTWEIDTLGIYGSYLNDVWIVNENDIWVVGNIDMPDPDSSHNGTGRESFNAAHWDGSMWELIKIQPQGYVQPIKCIYYFNESDIWFGQGGLPIQWNGDEYYMFMPANGEHPGQPTINAMWGTSSNNIYFVGDYGSIVHYDGSEFVEMESGTELHLADIAGTSNGEHIFVTGRTMSGDLCCGGVALYKQGENSWETLYTGEYGFGNSDDNENFGLFYAVKVFGDTAYFAITEEWFLKYNYITESASYIPKHHITQQGYTFWTLEMNDINNIILNHRTGIIAHFNGVSWAFDETIFQSFFNSGTNYYINGSDYKDNLMVFTSILSHWPYAVIVKITQE